MTAPAAFKATFSDFRLVKGRKVAQIVVEVPLEEADAALKALGGIPRPDLDRWVAVARLSPETATTASASPNNRERPSSAADRSDGAPASQVSGRVSGENRGGWYALKPSARAALLCKDETFRAWADKHFKLALEGDEDTAGWMRAELRINSRAQVDNGHPQFSARALKAFNAIEHEYRTSRGLEPESR